MIGVSVIGLFFYNEMWAHKLGELLDEKNISWDTLKPWELCIPWERAERSKQRSKLDFLLYYGLTTCLNFEDAIKRIWCLKALEKSGVTVINKPDALEIAISKPLTSFTLEQKRVPTPKFIFSNDLDLIENFFKENERVLVKPSIGYGGEDINLFEAWEELREYLRKRLSSPLFFQEYLEHGNYDYRVVVVDGKVVSSIKREGKGWKCNLHSGAKAKPHEPSEKITKLALKAVEAIGLNIAGVDIIETKKGLMVIEVNSCPGFYKDGEFYEEYATYKDVYNEKLLEALVNLIEKRKP